MQRLLTAFAIPMLAACILMAGCKSGPAGPEAVVEQFNQAMNAGEFLEAAALFDYDTAARRQNSDWDTFGAAQRKLIIEKLQKDKAQELQGFQAAYKSENYQVGEAAIQGNQATVPLRGTNAALTVSLAQVDGKWRIQAIR